ncbi:MAG: hypothetical protein NVSMB52_07990 [Chloroflexota bacterium]
MNSVTFTIAGLRGAADATDLSNALSAANGVGSVHVDAAAHTIHIEYDASFCPISSLQVLINGSGYPIQQ